MRAAIVAGLECAPIGVVTAREGANKVLRLEARVDSTRKLIKQTKPHKTDPRR
jgi:hypothetical protein